MGRYRKKPVVIEAWQFIGAAHSNPMPDWLVQAIHEGRIYYQGGDDPYFTVKMKGGTDRAYNGDWIIKGVEGKLYPCSRTVFEATYEAA